MSAIETPHIEIVPVRKANALPAICNLLNEALGELHDLEYLAEIVDQPSEAMIIGAYVAAKPALVGASYVIRLHAGMEEETAPFDWPTSEQYASDEFVCLVSSAVIPSFQGIGIGKHMAQRRIRWATTMDCRWAVALCWESGRERTSLPLLTSLGFEEVERRTDAWTGMPCPVCGDNCQCSGVVVKRGLG